MMNQRTDQSNLAEANMENVSALLKTLSSAFTETNQYWLARAKAEGEFGSDLVTKLAAVRSMPEVASVYQEWLGHRMQRLAEDGQKLAADSQKLVRSCTEFFSQGNGNGSS
jgi:hypothetical protein